MRVTKHYSRKVNLKAISSRYDNVELGTFVSATIECEDEKQFNEKTAILAEEVRLETERDIEMAIRNLIDMSKDNSHSAVLGLGAEVVEVSALASEIDGFAEILNDQKKIQSKNSQKSLPSDLEEVEF